MTWTPSPRWLAFAAIGASLTSSALGHTIVKAPNPLAAAPAMTIPDISTPSVGSPAVGAAPSITVPTTVGPSAVMDLPAVTPITLDRPKPSTLPGAPISTKLTPPSPLTVPRLDPMSAGAPSFTTQADVAMEAAKIKREHLARERGARHAGAPSVKATRHASSGSPGGASRTATDAVVVPASVVPVAAVGAPPAPPNGSGCQPGGDIEQMLSKACLESLRDDLKSSPAMNAPPSAAPSVQCGLVIVAANGVPGAPSTFTTPGIEQCLATATRLSYGIAGSSNITVEDPVTGLVAVTCRRPPPDGRTISCEAQR